MNTKLDLTKLQDYLQKNKQYLPILVTVLFFLTFSVLTFVALYPTKDDQLEIDSQARLEELDIKFNTKILQELETKQKPTEITGIGGRDPFANF